MLDDDTMPNCKVGADASIEDTNENNFVVAEDCTQGLVELIEKLIFSIFNGGKSFRVTRQAECTLRARGPNKSISFDSLHKEYNM